MIPVWEFRGNHYDEERGLERRTVAGQYLQVLEMGADAVLAHAIRSAGIAPTYSPAGESSWPKEDRAQHGAMMPQCRAAIQNFQYDALIT